MPQPMRVRFPKKCSTGSGREGRKMRHPIRAADQRRGRGGRSAELDISSVVVPFFFSSLPSFEILRNGAAQSVAHHSLAFVCLRALFGVPVRPFPFHSVGLRREHVYIQPAPPRKTRVHPRIRSRRAAFRSTAYGATRRRSRSASFCAATAQGTALTFDEPIGWLRCRPHFLHFPPAQGNPKPRDAHKHSTKTLNGAHRRQVSVSDVIVK